MTLAERRQQVKRDRGELSPMHSYIDPRAEKPSGTPHPRSTEPADRGPAANRSATPFGAQATGNPSWVSAYATAYPAMLSIGGQLQLPTGTTASSVSGMWLYVRDEAGNYVHQQEIKRTTGDPSGRYLDNGDSGSRRKHGEEPVELGEGPGQACHHRRPRERTE
ncbi:hypothetical protein OG923_06890 [Streptomyces halstedii]|uniref:hypothetical protein n=1 Tax=Streptomyces halstedii TaxID=1944 RepID=UPI003245F55D